MQDGYAQITDITTGVDVTGAQELFDTIRTGAIQEARNVLMHENSEFITTLKAGWSGASVGAYIEKFNFAVGDIYDALDNMEKGIQAQFTGLTQTWVEQDQNIIGLD